MLPSTYNSIVAYPLHSVKSGYGVGARTICQEGHGTTVPFLKAPLTRAGREGAESPPSANPFFSLFPAL
jgi:hypothetical protein